VCGKTTKEAEMEACWIEEGFLPLGIGINQGGTSLLGENVHHKILPEQRGGEL